MNDKSPTTATLDIGTAATLACVLEVTAPKPGNVHRGADFEDVTYLDFITSAIVSGPIIGRVRELGIGRTVLEAVRATRSIARSNTNLGTLLLIAPLAAVPGEERLFTGIDQVLRGLTFDDTRQVFEAIRISAAGGLGRTAEADVSDEPPANLQLVDAMRMAGDRDLVARQYCNDFADVCRIADWIEHGIAEGLQRDTAIVRAQLRQLANEADSLIVRKCGPQVGEQARAMAERILDAGPPGDENYEHTLADFDFWLRSDGHRRNPGTTADLIAAALFLLLRDGRLELRP